MLPDTIYDLFMFCCVWCEVEVQFHSFACVDIQLPSTICCKDTLNTFMWPIYV